MIEVTGLIFAKLIYDEHYDEFHAPVVACLKEIFPDLQHGHQCDSWVWITEGEVKVEVDTFYAMHHEVRCRVDAPIVHKVIKQLQTQFTVKIVAPPQEDPTDGLETFD